MFAGDGAFVMPDGGMMKRKQQKVKTVKKRREEVPVVLGKGEWGLPELFDLSEKECNRIVAECFAAQTLSRDDFLLLAKAFGVYGGGSLALRGYCFGRMIAERQTKSELREALQGMLRDPRDEDDEEDDE